MKNDKQINMLWISKLFSVIMYTLCISCNQLIWHWH